MRVRASALVGLAVAAALLAGGEASATVFGLKSCGSTNATGCGGGNVLGGGSIAPTVLFSFDETTGVLAASSPTVTRGGTPIHADALAVSANGALFAFDLATTVTPLGAGAVSADVTASTLVTLDAGTGAATAVGATLAGRDLRGAAFGSGGILWALDAGSDELLTISTATGAVDTSVALTLGGAAFDLATASDIALRADGAAFVSSGADLYGVDLLTGALSPLLTDAGNAYAGLTFSDGAAADLLFGYEVNGTEDVFTFDLANANARALLTLNIIPTLGGGQFNAGRGDLAAQVTFAANGVPTPSSVALAVLGLPLLAAARRRRGRPPG